MGAEPCVGTISPFESDGY